MANHSKEYRLVTPWEHQEDRSRQLTISEWFWARSIALKHGHHFKEVGDTSRHESEERRLVPIRVTLTQRPIKRKRLTELYWSWQRQQLLCSTGQIYIYSRGWEKWILTEITVSSSTPAAMLSKRSQRRNQANQSTVQFLKHEKSTGSFRMTRRGISEEHTKRPGTNISQHTLQRILISWNSSAFERYRSLSYDSEAPRGFEGWMFWHEVLKPHFISA